MSNEAELDALRDGIYTVREICSILRPSMTPRKVHYWLDKGMLGKPVSWGAPGYPTLLSFEQVLRIRTLQRIRDELKFSLRKAREALEWILDNLVAEGWHDHRFFRMTAKTVGVTDGSATVEIPTGQGVLDSTIPELTEFIQSVRKQWEQGVLRIEGFERIVSDPTVMGGSPVIVGTRIETSFIANLAGEESLAELKQLFPKVDEEAIHEAAEFEDVELVA